MLSLPSALRAFAEALNNDGVTLYAVGGCVRDAYLGRPVHDIDLCSRLKPDELMRFAGERGIETRIVQQTLGTVLLSIDGQTFEHTTFRTDSIRSVSPIRHRSTRCAATFRSTRCTNPSRTERCAILAAGWKT